MAILDRLTPATRAWFEASFPAPTPAQSRGWEAIASGDHTLSHAPAGSGQTLAAFVGAVERLLLARLRPMEEGCRVRYTSPLAALACGIARSLRAPLVGIRQAAE